MRRRTVPLEFASTAQGIGYYSRQRPTEIAIVEGNSTISYRQLAIRLAQFTKALRAISIGRGTVVGIETENAALHWLLILSAELIGAPALSFRRDKLSNPDFPFKLCDVFLTTARDARLGTGRIHILTSEWVKSVLNINIRPSELKNLETAPSPDDTVRFTTSSGTTGSPKLFTISYRIQQGRITKNVGLISKHISAPRYISFYSWWNLAALISANATLQMGGQVILTTKNEFSSQIRKHKANFSLLVAGDCESVVTQLTNEFEKPENFLIDVRGAPISLLLRARALEKIASQVHVVYATNEVGPISVAKEDEATEILPGVEIRIVDEDGREELQKDAESGLLLVRTDTMIQNYFENDPESARAFKDGWFNTKDVGRIDPDGRLAILGRSDDIVNVGGVKFPPVPVEHTLKSVLGVREAVIVGVVNENGIGVPGVAVEADSDLGIDLMKERIRQFFAGRRCYLLLVRSAPRTDNGKVKRREIKSRIQALASDQERIRLEAGEISFTAV
jgi:long-chain acyl-CoA synthetase